MSLSAVWIRCLRVLLALTWLYQGLWLKLIVRDPQHLHVVESVGPVAGLAPADFLTLIGAGETLLALGILSGLLHNFVAVFQIALLVSMNSIGILSGGVEKPLGLVVGNLPLLFCMLLHWRRGGAAA